MNISSPLVSVRALTKKYGDLLAVDGISFDIAQGEVVGLLGPNGAGKSTTIHMLLGLLTPSAGTITIFGLPLTHHRSGILGRVNFAASYAAMPYNLTVEENLRIFAGLYNVRNVDSRIVTLLDRFSIVHLRKKKVGKLSSGETARVTLAKAFLNNPELLFFDEPTASLDPDFADQVRKQILELKRERNVTIFWTSHNMREVEEMCDRILFLQHGKIIADAPPAELIRQVRVEDLDDVFITLARNNRRTAR